MIVNFLSLSYRCDRARFHHGELHLRNHRALFLQSPTKDPKQTHENIPHGIRHDCFINGSYYYDHGVQYALLQCLKGRPGHRPDSFYSNDSYLYNNPTNHGHSKNDQKPVTSEEYKWLYKRRQCCLNFRTLG